MPGQGNGAAAKAGKLRHVQFLLRKVQDLLRVIPFKILRRHCYAHQNGLRPGEQALVVRIPARTNWPGSCKGK